MTEGWEGDATSPPRRAAMGRWMRAPASRRRGSGSGTGRWGVKNPSTPRQAAGGPPPHSPSGDGEETTQPRIERGDVNPVEPVFTSPHQVRVGTWPLRFWTLASAPAGEPGDGRLYPCDSCSVAFRFGLLTLTSSTDPGLVLRDPSRRSVQCREPGPCPVFPPSPESAFGTLGQRAGPTRLKPRSPWVSAPPCPSAKSGSLRSRDPASGGFGPAVQHGPGAGGQGR